MASIFLTVFHFHFHQLLLSVGHRLSWSLNSPEIHSSVTWCRVRSRLGWENNLCISISLVRFFVCILSSIAHNDFLHPIILVVFAFTKNNLRTKTYISIACRPFDHLQWNVGPVKKGSPSVPTASLLVGRDRALPGGKPLSSAASVLRLSPSRLLALPTWSTWLHLGWEDVKL